MEFIVVYSENYTEHTLWEKMTARIAECYRWWHTYLPTYLNGLEQLAVFCDCVKLQTELHLRKMQFRSDVWLNKKPCSRLCRDAS